MWTTAIFMLSLLATKAAFDMATQTIMKETLDKQKYDDLTDLHSHVDDPSQDETAGTTAALCEWAIGLKSSNVPSPILERVKHLILDGIACGLVGGHVPWSEQAAEAIVDYEPPGYCSVIGYDETLGPLSAAILNGAFIQATELDDYHSSAPLHSASVVLPAILAASQFLSTGNGRGKAKQKVSGLDFLMSAVVGFETGPRAGAGMGGGELLVRGWHSGAIFGCPAAAMASSRLLGLSAEKTESAIGIACTQAGGLMSATYEGMIKRVQHAFAARNGLFGALLARNGYLGIRKVFERRYGGFLSMFSKGNNQTPQYDVRRVTENLGDTWQIFNIRVKLYACVGGCHGQIEALDKLQRQHPERFEAEALRRIVSIKVGLSGPIFAHDGWAPHERPLATTGAQMNAAYIGAVQLVDRQVLLEQFADNSLNRDEVWDLVYKTTCYHDTRFDKPHFGCGARITIEFDDGVKLEEVLDQPRGFNPPVKDEEIAAKYRKLARSAIDDEQRIEKIEKLILGMEQLDDISELLQLISLPTKKVL
ncbi:putative MmgE/PrpD family protein [Seiridium unicorne]|uniref:MmgE/PrpD family protein n=1 Tax=Seiridium unicorne TaxID=138068 RepID=A0ABR2V4S8_9PEZI